MKRATSKARTQAGVRYRWPRRTFLMVAAVFCLSACGGNPPSRQQKPPSSQNSCQVVSHQLGETEICGTPERIVALDPHFMDLSIALGVEPIGYAQTRYVASGKSGEPIPQIPYLGQYIDNKPTNVGTRQQPSLEAILELQPDLIVGQFIDPSLYEKLSQLTPTVYPVRDVYAYREEYRWQEVLKTYGKILGKSDRAEAAIAEYERTIAETAKKLPSEVKQQRWLLVAMSGVEAMVIFDEPTFAGNLLEQLGFNLASLPEELQGKGRLGEIPISMEKLTDVKADAIIVMASSKTSQQEIKTLWQETPLLRSLPAAKAEQVYFVDYQLWSRIRGPTAAKLIIDKIQKIVESHQNHDG